MLQRHSWQVEELKHIWETFECKLCQVVSFLWTQEFKCVFFHLCVVSGISTLCKNSTLFLEPPKLHFYFQFNDNLLDALHGTNRHIASRIQVS